MMENASATLFIFGCASCGGDHSRGVGATLLTPPLRLEGVEYQRAFVCPMEPRVVLVSDESEEARVLT
jgi:hypothetical protein